MKNLVFNEEVFEIGDVVKVTKEGLKKEPFQLINYFIKKIILFNDEIKIEFYNPIKKSPDDSQDFCFYEGTTVYYKGEWEYNSEGVPVPIDNN